MVAPGACVDFRCPAELTHRNHQSFVEEPAAIEVVDQGRKRLVGRWNKVVLEPAEDVCVSVPVGDLPVVLAIVDRDETDAGFDQTASQENALAESYSGRSGHAVSDLQNPVETPAPPPVSGAVAMPCRCRHRTDQTQSEHRFGRENRSLPWSVLLPWRIWPAHRPR